MPIRDTYRWIQTAIPEPTEQDGNTQFGVFLEEVGETMEAAGIPEMETDILYSEAYDYKVGHSLTLPMSKEERILFLDGLCDVIVTAVTTAYTHGFDIVGAMEEVNRANFSKFEDGKPIYDSNRKVMKGKDYVAPNLEPFIGE